MDRNVFAGSALDSRAHRKGLVVALAVLSKDILASTRVARAPP
jgi:hypothetical protein